MVTPGQRYRGEDAEVLRRRRETMLEARRNQPERWIGDTVMNCTLSAGYGSTPRMNSLRKSVCQGVLEQTLQLIFITLSRDFVYSHANI